MMKETYKIVRNIEFYFKAEIQMENEFYIPYVRD